MIARTNSMKVKPSCETIIASQELAGRHSALLRLLSHHPTTTSLASFPVCEPASLPALRACVPSCPIVATRAPTALLFTHATKPYLPDLHEASPPLPHPPSFHKFKFKPKPKPKPT